MHEIKLIFTDQKEEGKTKLLHITDLFEYTIEMIVPSNCIGLKIFEGDMIENKLLYDLSFVEDDAIITKAGEIIGWFE